MKKDGLPAKPKSNQQVLEVMKNIQKQNDSNSKFKDENELKSEGEQVARLCNGMYYKSNQMHFDTFPGVAQCESEIVQMMINLYKGGDEECGLMDISDFDNIRNALWCHRFWAKDIKGITKPNVVTTSTFNHVVGQHCRFLDIELRIVKVDKNVKVTAKQFYNLIDKNTILLLCSSPDMHFGQFDPVKDIAKLAEEHGIGCHVDCTSASFIATFAEELKIEGVDAHFKTPGITTIGISTCRYGLGPFGASVILYKTRKLRRYQYFQTCSWNGGIYGTPTLSGSRYGSAIAGTW